MCLYVNGCTGPLRAQVKSPGAEVTGSCELPDSGTRNQTPIFSKSSKRSLPLSHLSSLALRTPQVSLSFLVSCPLLPCGQHALEQDGHSHSIHPGALCVCLTFFSSKPRSKHHTNHRFQPECREEGIVIHVCSE